MVLRHMQIHIHMQQLQLTKQLTFPHHIRILHRILMDNPTRPTPILQRRHQEVVEEVVTPDHRPHRRLWQHPIIIQATL